MSFFRCHPLVVVGGECVLSLDWLTVKPHGSTTFSFCRGCWRLNSGLGACLPCQHFYWAVSYPLKVVLKQQVQNLRGDGRIITDALGNGNWRTKRKCDVHSNLKRDEDFRERVGEGLAGSPRYLTRAMWLAGSPRHLTRTMLLPAFFPPCTKMCYIKVLVAEETFFSSPPTSDLP